MSNNPTSASSYLESERVQHQQEAATPHRRVTNQSVFDLVKLHDALLQSVHQLEQSMENAEGDILLKRASKRPVQSMEFQSAIDSQDDALKFFETMTDLMKSQDTLPFEFTEGLDNLIKGCGVPELPETGSSLGEGSGENGSGGTGQGSNGGGSSILDGLEFFDFSSYGLDDDHESKAATPDLVPTSSTNPSPSSRSEVDAAHGGSMSTSNGVGAVDPAITVDLVKSEVDSFDPPRLKPFQEIYNNGESWYYSDFGSWKWEGAMGTFDSPRAFWP